MDGAKLLLRRNIVVELEKDSDDEFHDMSGDLLTDLADETVDIDHNTSRNVSSNDTDQVIGYWKNCK